MKENGERLIVICYSYSQLQSVIPFVSFSCQEMWFWMETPWGPQHCEA